MKKDNYAWWKILLGLVLCFGISAGVFFGFLFTGIEEQNIAKTGTEATAKVVGIEEGTTSTTSIGDIETTTQYYRIKFTFLNAEGTEISGKTNDAYTSSDLLDMGIIDGSKIIVGKEFKVKYIGNKAVASDYKNRGGSGFLWVIVIIFGICGVVILVSYAVYLVNVVNFSKIKRYGTEGIGTYMEHTNSNYNASSGIIGQIKSGYKQTMGTSRHCRIYFTFTNNYGELI